jgi:hypothetical protein
LARLRHSWKASPLGSASEARWPGGPGRSCATGPTGGLRRRRPETSARRGLGPGRALGRRGQRAGRVGPLGLVRTPDEGLADVVERPARGPLAVRRGDQLVERGQGRVGVAEGRQPRGRRRARRRWRAVLRPRAGAGEPEVAAHLLAAVTHVVDRLLQAERAGSSRAATALASSRLTRRRTFVRTVASGRMR